jgi:hypothetical protein
LGQAAVGKNASGQDLILDGKPVAFGIGTHAPSVIEYDLPAGYETFEATGALDAGSRGRGSVQLFVYSDKAVVPVPENATVTASLADAGFTGPVRIRDLWSHQDLGVFEKEFSRDIAFHGAGLYRVSPAQMPLKVAFEGRESEHKWPLRNWYCAQLPSTGPTTKFLVQELKTSTPQRFSLWLHPPRANAGSCSSLSGERLASGLHSAAILQGQGQRAWTWPRQQPSQELVLDGGWGRLGN